MTEKSLRHDDRRLKYVLLAAKLNKLLKEHQRSARQLDPEEKKLIEEGAKFIQSLHNGYLMVTQKWREEGLSPTYYDYETYNIVGTRLHEYGPSRLPDILRNLESAREKPQLSAEAFRETVSFFSRTSKLLFADLTSGQYTH